MVADLPADCVATNQGENQMETVLDLTFEQRLAALDRAINRLQANHEATPDEVVAMAEKFEQYLSRTNG